MKITSKIISSLLMITLELNASSFVNECRNSLKPSLNHTYSQLKKVFKKENCQELFDHLSKVNVLSLNNLELTNISPLQYFSHFEEIDLSNNSLDSFDPLIKNNNLRRLDLSSNQISSLSKLEKLEKLKKLRVLNLSKNDLF